MSLDTSALQCFVALASTNNFTKAAHKVNRTQSALSQQIARLESLCGVELIDRRNGASLTSAGELFYSYAKKILALQLEVIERFKQPQLEGEIRFGLPEDFASLFLADVLVDFARIHPRILLKIECGLTLNLYERFTKHEFDLVLVKMSIPDNFDYGKTIWSEKLEWVANKQVEQQLTTATAATLPLVLAPQPCVYRARALSALDAAGLPWQILFSSPSYNGTVAAVKAGIGITVLPRNMIPNYLKIVHSPWLPALSDSHTSLLKHNDRSPAVASLEDFILQRLHR